MANDLKPKTLKMNKKKPNSTESKNLELMKNSHHLKFSSQIIFRVILNKRVSCFVCRFEKFWKYGAYVIYANRARYVC